MFVIYSSLHIFSDLLLHFSEPTREGKMKSEKRKRRKEKKRREEKSSHAAQRTGGRGEQIIMNE
jgi:hypothetical protein